MTIATLIRLLKINIVANNFFGLDNRSKTLKLFELDSSLRLILSLKFNEKYATSEPEIIADKETKINISSKETPNPKVKGKKILVIEEVIVRTRKESKLFIFV